MAVGLMVTFRDREVQAGISQKEMERVVQAHRKIVEKWDSLGYKPKWLMPFKGDSSQYAHIILGEIADAEVAFQVRLALWGTEDYLGTLAKNFEYSFFLGPLCDAEEIAGMGRPT